MLFLFGLTFLMLGITFDSEPLVVAGSVLLSMFIILWFFFRFI
jgi:hypothetical protein